MPARQSARPDPDAVAKCHLDKLCGVCGKRLGYWIVFLGGAGNRATRRFPHPPMHRECAERLLANDPFWSTPVAERTRQWYKHAREADLRGELEWTPYLTRGYEFNWNSRLFEAWPPKEY